MNGLTCLGRVSSLSSEEEWAHPSSTTHSSFFPLKVFSIHSNLFCYSCQLSDCNLQWLNPLLPLWLRSLTYQFQESWINSSRTAFCLLSFQTLPLSCPFWLCTQSSQQQAQELELPRYQMEGQGSQIHPRAHCFLAPQIHQNLTDSAFVQQL